MNTYIAYLLLQLWNMEAYRIK